MQKLTRRIKKNKKNKSIKIGGDNSNDLNDKVNERKGVLDIVGDKITDVASSAATSIGDAGLKIVGLERIDKPIEEVSTNKLDENIEKIDNTESGILSNVKNIADKTGAAIIENVNEVLGTDIVKETTAEAAKNTAELVKESAEVFNKALNDPVVRREVEDAIQNASEIGTIIVDASKKPINKAVDVVAESIPKVSNAVVSGAANVTTDVLAALPGIGAIFDIGRMINDSSKAASSVVEASSEAIEAASDAFIETKEAVEKGLKELEEKKKMGQQIYNRTTKSINQFQNPTVKQQTIGGGRKTKRRLIKKRLKTKRVRFTF